ncbi:MAG: site-2 protease family protein [Eudoraea sp.]|nr:site-2 protease family protein [Eudoraea sp.]
MPVMKGILKLGKVAGISIEVHWTFSLLLIWVVFMELRQEGDLQSALFIVVLVLLLFLCVVLHELGHAFTAKLFHISTKKITLLPIGGVASLEKIPEKPQQELLVSVAGPLVNLLIAFVLYLFLPIQYYMGLDAENLVALLESPGLETLLFYLWIANIMLVVFNLVPAFPMDGGRVLRALLAMFLGRLKATEIASVIGRAIAVMFLILGLFYNPFLVLIALFIYVGAYSENQLVKQSVKLEGYHVKDAMLTKITTFSPEHSLEEVIETIIAGTEKDFIVIENRQVIGILFNRDIIKNSKKIGVKVGTVMKTAFKSLDATGDLKKLLPLIVSDKQRFFPVVSADKSFVGAIDMTNLSEFLLLKANLISK